MNDDFLLDLMIYDQAIQIGLLAFLFVFYIGFSIFLFKIHFKNKAAHHDASILRKELEIKELKRIKIYKTLLDRKFALRRLYNTYQNLIAESSTEQALLFLNKNNKIIKLLYKIEFRLSKVSLSH